MFGKPTSLFGSQPTTGQSSASSTSIFGNQAMGSTSSSLLGTQPSGGAPFAFGTTMANQTLGTSSPIVAPPKSSTSASFLPALISSPAVQNSNSAAVAPALFGISPVTTDNIAIPASGSKLSTIMTSIATPLSFGNQPAAVSVAPSSSSVGAFGISVSTGAATTAIGASVFGVSNDKPTSLFGSQPTTGQSSASSTSIFGNQAMGSTSSSLLGTQPSGGVPLSFGNNMANQTVGTPSPVLPKSTTSASFLPALTSSTAVQNANSAAVAPALFGISPVTTDNTAIPASVSKNQPEAVSVALSSSSNAALGISAATTATGASAFGVSNDSAKMSYKDLEQTLKVLRMDFESQEKQFLDEVDDLNTYDNILRKAQDKIGSLATEVDQLEREKDRFKYELQVVEQQQTELDNLVTEMEKVLGLPDYTQGTSIGIREPATTADIQRQNILQLQVTVDAQLKQIDDDVTDICEQLLDLQKIGGVNGLESSNFDSEKEEQAAVVDQIRQILRKQIDTLGWVDKQSDVLGKKVQKTAAEILIFQK